MTPSGLERDRDRDASKFSNLLFDPRLGDAEDDASSPKQRSLLAMAGSLLAEISLPKLAFAWTISLAFPALVLGAMPLVVTTWATKLSRTVAELTGLGTALMLLLFIGLGWVGWRPLLRTAETSFWSLNALAVQPGYTFVREGLRYLIERVPVHRSLFARTRLRATSSIGAAVILCTCSLLIATAVWPASRWIGGIAGLGVLHDLLLATLANAVVLVAAFLAVASIVWGIADAKMDQLTDFTAFATSPVGTTWRIAHLSDIHMVGERYGFRIESGRGGPRGNTRFTRIMSRIEAIDNVQPLDLVLVSGDMTDAGRATEWAEFLDALAQHPALAQRMIILPGNHDLNIVDRLNPARLDLPFSPGKRLRQMRALSAIVALQGDRLHVIDHQSWKIGPTLAEALAPHRDQIATFLDSGSLRHSARLGRLWDDQFPMVMPPRTEDGLGVAILNSNAETHFSFTNALGMISVEQAQGLAAAFEQFPKARWLVALHHHLLEYPMSVASLAERIGTALINGSWFVRKLGPFARRTVVMHGHRHIDWIGSCGELKIISAPSPVMGAKNSASTYFLIHSLLSRPDGELCLLRPQRVDIAGGSDSSSNLPASPPKRAAIGD